MKISLKKFGYREFMFVYSLTLGKHSSEGNHLSNYKTFKTVLMKVGQLWTFGSARGGGAKP